MTSIIGNAIDYISYLNDKVIFDKFTETLLCLAAKSGNAIRTAPTIFHRKFVCDKEYYRGVWLMELGLDL